MIVLDGDRPPAEECLPFLGDDAGQQLLEPEPRPGLSGEEDGARAVGSQGRQVDARSGHDLPEETIRRLDQEAGAVAGVRLAAAGAAVLQVDQDLQAARDDRMGSPTRYVDDEPDATGIVFERRVVQSLSLQRVDVVIRHVVFMADQPVLAKYNDRIAAMRLTDG